MSAFTAGKSSSTGRIVVLGTDALAIDAGVARESASVSASELLSSPADAAVVAARGEPAFFRTSLALERGVKRVIVRSGSMPDAWMAELAARASALGGEVFARDDERYLRLRAGARVEVSAPSFDDDVTPPTSDALLPAVDRCAAFHCEEVAFAAGLKPVLYLVAEKEMLPAILARHPGAVMRDDRITATASSGERAYGAGSEVAHVFVGERAERAAQLWADDSSRHVEELGELMGYPSCCVRAFAAMASRRINAAFPYVVAARTRALGGRFDGLLDVTSARLIPFVPCAYDCTRAIAWAARVAVAAGVEKPGRHVLYIDEQRALELVDATREGDTVAYRSARWAAEPNEALQRAFGGIFSGPGSLLIDGDSVAVGAARLARAVYLPFTRLPDSIG